MTRPVRSNKTTRRAFLATVATAATAIGFHRATQTSGAFAATPTSSSLVWRLDSHWGYPTGTRKRTHCKCNACVHHATNKVFATQADAEAGRIHPHCECQIRAVQFNAAGYDDLFLGKPSADLRRAGVADIYAKFVVPSH